MIHKAITAFCLLLPGYVLGQNTVSKKEINQLVGCWKGTLTYLDYTSGKLYTMPANLVVKKGEKRGELVLNYIYPKEPKANSFDTMQVSAGGNKIDNEEIISKQKGNNDLIIVTQRNGVDGNDNQPALIRYTYTIGREKYAKKKEVQFVGTAEWILRNESVYDAAPCTSVTTDSSKK